MGMDQWRCEDDGMEWNGMTVEVLLAPIWSAKPACTGWREQAESRKTDRRPTGVHVIGVALERDKNQTTETSASPSFLVESPFLHCRHHS